MDRLVGSITHQSLKSLMSIQSFSLRRVSRLPQVPAERICYNKREKQKRWTLIDYPKPENESARLEALRRYRLMDTAPEQVYDDIVKIAAHICEVPTVLITLLDEHRQWFKSRMGLGVEETPREQAFCSHAIMTPETMIVEDAQQDDRFKDNPLVTGNPHIRFYMGAPLVDLDGFALGTLCVIDSQPRKMRPDQVEALEALRRIVVHEFTQRKVAFMLAEALKELKTLNGLLPICANCKSVRSDDGYWKRIEEYMEERSDARFSHGICPSCVEKLYPDLVDKITEK